MTSRRLAPCFILFSAFCLGAAAAERDRPNIVMIAIDDMNDWIGALGGPAITPHIDRLAAEGVLFNNAHCVVPACNPSRVAIMTGLRPETTGQYENAGNIGIRGCAYLDAMSYADACVGRILEAIDAFPDHNNTIVVRWTDHGWQLGHKNRR